eukprot:g49332.t1
MSRWIRQNISVDYTTKTRTYINLHPLLPNNEMHGRCHLTRKKGTVNFFYPPPPSLLSSWTNAWGSRCGRLDSSRIHPRFPQAPKYETNKLASCVRCVYMLGCECDAGRRAGAASLGESAFPVADASQPSLSHNATANAHGRRANVTQNTSALRAFHSAAPSHAGSVNIEATSTNAVLPHHCQNNSALSQYLAFHSRFKSSPPSGFLVGTCKSYCGGIADRLRGVPFLVDIAIMTRRIFLLSWTWNLDPLSAYLMPNAIDWTSTSTGIENMGEDCWAACGNRGGKCGFCGFAGYCCRQGYDDPGCNGQGGELAFILASILQKVF